MKKIAIALISICAFLSPAFSQLGVGTNTPDSSAMLDVFSNNKGMLIPRVALTATNVAAPVSGPATSLLVYNTATAGTAPNNVKPGFYYWTGSAWYPVLNKGNNVGDMQYWDGTKWVMIPIGTNGSYLTICGGIPTWGVCPATSPLTIIPAASSYEGFISSNNPSSWSYGIDQIPVGTWTNGGTLSLRTIIKFDYSSLPPGAIVDSAKLYLYADLSPQYGNQVDPMYNSGAGTGNACFVQQITSAFNLPAGFTWNSPPIVTTTNQAVIPATSSNTQGAIVNVTGMVANMLVTNNYGFLIRLQTEAIYNIQQFASSYYADPNRRPKLVIYFH